MTFKFEQERLKPILESFLQYGCNFEEMPCTLKKQFRVYMHENIP
jgi:hypothetical protein